MVGHAPVAGVRACGGADATSSTQGFAAWLVQGFVGESFGAFAATYSAHPFAHSTPDEHDS